VELMRILLGLLFGIGLHDKLSKTKRSLYDRIKLTFMKRRNAECFIRWSCTV